MAFFVFRFLQLLTECPADVATEKPMGPESFVLSVCFFASISYSVHFPCYLQHFGAGNCHFNGMAFLSSKLSFSMEFAIFLCYVQHFGAGSCHFNGIFAACLRICNNSGSFRVALRASLGFLLGLV